MIAVPVYAKDDSAFEGASFVSPVLSTLLLFDKNGSAGPKEGGLFNTLDIGIASAMGRSPSSTSCAAGADNNG